jgi:hypothetical protein
MPLYGQDMRKACQKAESEHKTSLDEAKDAEKRILENRRSIQKEIAGLESEIKSLNKDITSTQNTFNKL